MKAKEEAMNSRCCLRCPLTFSDRMTSCLLETLKIDVFCVSGTSIKDPTSAIVLRTPDPTWISHSILRVSGDPILRARVRAGIQIALGTKPDGALLDSIPLHSRLYAVRPDGSVHINNSRLKPMCLSCLNVLPLTAAALMLKTFHRELT